MITHSFQPFRISVRPRTRRALRIVSSELFKIPDRHFGSDPRRRPMAHGINDHHQHHHHHHDHDPDPTPTADPPPPPAPDFAQLGATFNDATRALVGGLWQNAVEEGGQGNGSVFRYVNDLQSVSQGLQAEVNAGQFSGATLANVQSILTDIATATSAATASVNGGGTFGSVA